MPRRQNSAKREEEKPTTKSAVSRDSSRPSVPANSDPPTKGRAPSDHLSPWLDPTAGPDQLTRELAAWLKANGFVPENYICGFIQHLEDGRQDIPQVAIPKDLRIQRKNGVILHDRLRMPDQWPCPEADFDWEDANRRNSLRALDLLGEGKLTNIVTAVRDQDTGEWVVDFDISSDLKLEPSHNWTLRAWFDGLDLQSRPAALEAWKHWMHDRMKADVEQWLRERQFSRGGNIAGDKGNPNKQAALDLKGLQSLAVAIKLDAYHAKAEVSEDDFQAGLQYLWELSPEIVISLPKALERELAPGELSRRGAEFEEGILRDGAVLGAALYATANFISSIKIDSSWGSTTRDWIVDSRQWAAQHKLGRHTKLGEFMALETIEKQPMAGIFRAWKFESDFLKSFRDTAWPESGGGKNDEVRRIAERNALERYLISHIAELDPLDNGWTDEEREALEAFIEKAHRAKASLPSTTDDSGRKEEIPAKRGRAKKGGPKGRDLKKALGNKAVEFVEGAPYNGSATKEAYLAFISSIRPKDSNAPWAEKIDFPAYVTFRGWISHPNR